MNDPSCVLLQTEAFFFFFLSLATIADLKIWLELDKVDVWQDEWIVRGFRVQKSAHIKLDNLTQ